MRIYVIRYSQHRFLNHVLNEKMLPVPRHFEALYADCMYVDGELRTIRKTC